MGTSSDVDYDLADVPPVVLPEEAMSTEALGDLVLAERKDVAALAAQLRAQEWTVVAERGRFFPVLALQGNVTGATRTFDNVVWNLGGQVTLSWPIFTGLQEFYGMRAAQATAHAIDAQRSALVLAARRAVEEARLTVLATKEAVAAADDALAAAKERMTLADARYETGVGTGLEIADARLQLTQANTARIQAGVDLAVARARLMAALGRPR
jgi:outer membrane protein